MVYICFVSFLRCKDMWVKREKYNRVIIKTFSDIDKIYDETCCGNLT